MGEASAAEALLRRAVQQARRHSGEEMHQAGLTASNSLGRVLMQRGRFDEAVALLRPLVNHQRAVYGDAHPSTPGFLANLATLLHRRGKQLGDAAHPELALPLFEEAEALSRRAVELYSDAHVTHPGLAKALSILCDSLCDVVVLRSPTRLLAGARAVRKARLSEAEVLSRSALAMFVDAMGEDHPQVAQFRANVQRIEQAKQRFEQV
jgi:tetratricopeptide (TPR) repeat protein